jgi:simple sugar transport system substrate-binding protein
MWFTEPRDSRKDRTGGRGARRLLIGAPVVLAATLALTACAGGRPNANGGTSAGGQATASAPAHGGGSGGKVRIYVVGGKSDDPFWSKVERGADDAARLVKAYGGSVTWLAPQDYNNLGPDAAKLVQTALNLHASAVIGPDWVPEAEDPAWKQVTQSGTPVIIYNAGGAAEAKTVGAIGYIGSDEYPAGLAGGKQFGAMGVKHVLCINTLPGQTESESRCKGIKDGLAASDGGKLTELPLSPANFGNPTAVTQAIKAALLHDSSIDAVATIGVSDADSAYSALQQGGLTGKVKLGTFDEDATQLQRIKAGQEAFAIDQQGYLQGYLAVSEAFQYVAWGLQIPTNNLLTGPLLITSKNVDLALAGAEAGVR